MAKTREYMDYLDEMIEIAPANSQEEYQAAEKIAAVMGDHGLEPSIEEFDAHPGGKLMPAFVTIVMFIALVAAGLTEDAVRVITLVLAIACVAILLARHFVRNVFEDFGPSVRSQNVVAVHRAEGEQVVKGARPIVIVAHYDTPRESFLRKGPLAQSQAALLRASVPCTIVVAVVLLFQIMLFLPGVIRTFAWVIGILAALPLVFLAIAAIYDNSAPCTIGANDNKSSVAALLSVLSKVRPGEDRVSDARTEGKSRQRASDRAAQRMEDARPQRIEIVEEVKGVRHGEAIMRALGIIPETCELVYEEPKVRVVEEAVQPMPVAAPKAVVTVEEAHDAEATDSEKVDEYDYDVEDEAYEEESYDEEPYEDEYEDEESYDEEMEEDYEAEYEDEDADWEGEEEQVAEQIEPAQESAALEDDREDADEEDYDEEEEGYEEDVDDDSDVEDEEGYEEEFDEDFDEDYEEDLGEEDEVSVLSSVLAKIRGFFSAIAAWFSELFARIRERIASKKEEADSSSDDIDEDDEDESIEFGDWIDDSEDLGEYEEEYEENSEPESDDYEGEDIPSESEGAALEDYEQELDESEYDEYEPYQDEVDEGEAAEDERQEDGLGEDLGSEITSEDVPVVIEDDESSQATYLSEEDLEWDDYYAEDEFDSDEVEPYEEEEEAVDELDAETEATELDDEAFEELEDDDNEWFDLEEEEPEDLASDEEDAESDRPTLGQRIKGFFSGFGKAASDQEDELYDDYLEDESYEEEVIEEYAEEDGEWLEDEFEDEDPVEEEYEVLDEHEDLDEYEETVEDELVERPSDPNELHFDREEDEDIVPRDTTGLDTISDSYDLYGSKDAETHVVYEKPVPVDDPNWGVSSYQPARPAINIARRAALFDLPDPSSRFIDPLADDEDDVDYEYEYEYDGVQEEDDRVVDEDVESTEPASDEDSVDDGQSFWSDAAPNVRGDWKGGAAVRSDLRGQRESDGDPIVIDADDLQDAILEMGDEFLVAHDIWFVATGGSSYDHAGIKAFLNEHRRDIRGAFLVNLESIGAGELSVIVNEGLHQPRRADRRLVRMIRTIAEDLHISLDTAIYDWDECESASCMRSRIRSVSIMGMDDNNLPAYSHTSSDIPDNVDPRQVSSVVRIITELIRRS